MPPDLSGKYRTLSLHLEPGHYTDVKQILDQLNHRKAPVTWTYSQVSRKVTLSWHERDWVVKLSDSVARETGLARRRDIEQTGRGAASCDRPVGGDLGRDRSPVCPLWPCRRLSPGWRQESAPLGCRECPRQYRWCCQLRALGAGLVASEDDLRKYHWSPHNRRSRQASAIWARRNACQGPREETLAIHLCGLTASAADIMRHYQGALYQRGFGIGSLFRGIFKTALPMLKSAGRAATRVGLRTGMGVVRDAARGRNLGESLKRRLGTEVVREIAPPLPKRRKQQVPIKRTNGVRPITKRKKRTRARHADVFDWSQRLYHGWGSPLAVFPAHATGQQL